MGGRCGKVFFILFIKIVAAATYDNSCSQTFLYLFLFLSQIQLLTEYINRLEIQYSFKYIQLRKLSSRNTGYLLFPFSFFFFKFFLSFLLVLKGLKMLFCYGKLTSDRVESIHFVRSNVQ